MSRLPICAALLLSLVACQDDGETPGYEALSKQVEATRVGVDSDHWVEMRNLAGEWERTGLIFGYVEDYEECQKAIAGLKAVNFEREYRCVPAN